MPDNPFQVAAKAALPAFSGVFGESVAYSREGLAVTLTALRNSQGADVVDAQGVYARAHRLEFTVKASDLVLNGAEVEPRRGDMVTDGDGAEYDVQAGADYLEGTDEWRIPVIEVDS